jgi:hypothetical protein
MSETMMNMASRAWASISAKNCSCCGRKPSPNMSLTPMEARVLARSSAGGKPTF